MADQELLPLTSFEELNIPEPETSQNLIDLNTVKDNNDNLEVQLANKQVCRTCFNIIEDLAYVTVNEDLEILINRCLPKLMLNLTRDPVVCQKCVEQLEEFYTFSINCMKVEEELHNYCTESPIDIRDFLIDKTKHIIDDFVEVKEEDNSNDSNSAEDENLKKPAYKRKFSSEDLQETPVKCEECGKKFKSKWALGRHKPFHKANYKTYTCNKCNLKFKNKITLKKHIDAHISGAPLNKPFSCECGKFFNRWAKLKKHKEVHIIKEKPFSCKDCGRRFTEEKLLDSHVERVHMKEKPFSCELCSNKYSQKSGLDVHFKTHFPSKNPRPVPDLMCDVCGKLFYRKYSLEKHRMSHTGDKPHQCEQCSMKFKERYQLTIHERRHTGEKPFKCNVCSFKFPSKSRLGLHMRTHTGVRPFSCKLCEMSFSRNDHLVKHVRAIHTGERPFECEICNKNFNRKDYLFKHKKVHLKNTTTE